MLIELKFSLSEQDYLVYNLFVASGSKQYKRNKLAGTFIVGSIYLIAGVFFFLAENSGLSIFFFLFGIAWMLFYPLRVKHRYKQHFLRYIHENLKESIDRPGTFAILEKEANLSVQGQEFRFSLDQISGIDRLPGYSLVRIKGGKTVIIPEPKVSEKDLNKVFDIIFKLTGIQPQLHQDWKW